MSEHPQLPPDVEALHELRAYIQKLRTEGGIAVNKLDEAPIDFPGVDDKTNRFDWYEIINTENEVLVGVFHTPRGFEL